MAISGSIGGFHQSIVKFSSFDVMLRMLLTSVVVITFVKTHTGERSQKFLFIRSKFIFPFHLHNATYIALTEI